MIKATGNTVFFSIVNEHRGNSPAVAMMCKASSLADRQTIVKSVAPCELEATGRSLQEWLFYEDSTLSSAKIRSIIDRVPIE